MLQNGTTHECWYDTRNPTIPQWQKPSRVAAIAFLSLGAVLFPIGAFVGFIMIFVVRIRKKPPPGSRDMRDQSGHLEMLNSSKYRP